MPFLRKMQSNGRGPRVEVFKIDRKIQTIHQSIALEKLSNFCEDTSWLSIMVWEWYLKNQNLMSIFKKMIREYFHRWSTKIWAQIEARGIYYLFPFNLKSNNVKHGILPNGSDPYG